MIEQGPPGGGEFEPEDPETGEPLSEVFTGVAGPVPPRFLGRVRERIHRKAVVHQVIDFAWNGLALVFLQWMIVLVGQFSPERKQEKGGEARDE